MKEQSNAGIIEPVLKSPVAEVVQYIPHQPVIKESSMLWIMYDFQHEPANMHDHWTIA